MDTELNRLEEELTQLGEQLGATGVGLEAFVRGVDRSTYRDYLLTHDRAAAPLAEADPNDRAAKGRVLGLSGLALQFFVEAGLPAAPRTVEAKRLPAPKPKGTPVLKPVKLRETRDMTEAELEAEIQATMDYIYGRRS